ncbi:MAG: (Fe-S)-binding protein [Deltaproteobacteria bacterium]|nr:(Fe-S)-binding protein [Deltaproteobacteria bacterium]MBW1960587.1 (Fe-S)-binding protein [Deltaproteobacteria bacterium]MBW1996210.1 (Fe-S)-binding protein [Deltaproteobacteria bacterium]MBW2150890.1 (Fe-S)-binding protein [Deltaproteobacteria bacterium]
MEKPNASELECIQCSKCQLVCPLNRVDPTYSPRGYTLQLLLEGDEEFTEDRDLFRCLTCFQCKEACPSRTKFIETVRKARQKARQKGRMDECKHGVILRTIQQFQAQLSVSQNRLVHLNSGTFADRGEILYFVGCLPIFDYVFPHTSSMSTAHNTLKILNAAGIKPVVSNDEKCCGYDLLWNGETDAFQKLAASNLKLFKKLGIKKIITSCAECLVTLKEEYPAIEAVEWQVQHITEFVAEALRNSSLKLNTPVEEKVTYHDPCRLGRISHVCDEPRYILKNIDALDFTEMEFVRENSRCCGVGGFSNCDKYIKFLQNDRLEEAAETGAGHVVTACPKCRIHFNCYLDGNPIGKLPSLKITDITEIMAKAL